MVLRIPDRIQSKLPCAFLFLPWIIFNSFCLFMGAEICFLHAEPMHPIEGYKTCHQPSHSLSVWLNIKEELKHQAFVMYCRVNVQELCRSHTVSVLKKIYLNAGRLTYPQATEIAEKRVAGVA